MKQRNHTTAPQGAFSSS